MLRRLLLDTPCGPLTVAATDGGVTAIRFGPVPSGSTGGPRPPVGWGAPRRRPH